MSALMRTVGPRSPLSRALRPLVNPFMPDGAVPLRVLGGRARGLRLVIEPRREKYYWTGAHELEVQDALAALLSPGRVFWDVGAHLGFFGLLAARLVSPGGTVHAFEPAAPSRTRLEEAVRLNRLPNVRVHALAVGAVPGTLRLYEHAASSMWSARPERCGGPSTTARRTTLDRLVAELGKPDVIKIDAEGAEADVLAGGRSLLGGPGRPTLIVERDDERLASLELLVPGYRCEPLGSRHLLLRGDV